MAGTETARFDGSRSQFDWRSLIVECDAISAISDESSGDILCVDNCADRLRAVRSTLEEAGYRVRTAADVSSAAHYASRSVLEGIVAHHSIVGHPEWQQLEDAFSSVPVLEYGDPSLMSDELGSCEAEAKVHDVAS